MSKAAHGSEKVASEAAVISLGGRFLTFVGRTMYMARFGTANPLLNAFVFALSLPATISQVLQTTLFFVLIPEYNSLLAKKESDDAKKFIDNVISISLILLVAMVALGIVGAPWIASLLEGGDFENPQYLTFALRVLMPVILFFGIGAVFQGILQSHGIFRLPAFVTAPGGIILILYLVLFGDRFGVTGLIFATAIGFATQPLLLLPAVIRLGYRYKFSLDFKNKNLRNAGKMCAPVMISVAAYHTHFIFGNMMALRLGTNAVMEYSQQLVQVFVLTIVFSITAVYFPKLTKQWAVSDTGGFSESLRAAMLYMAFLVMPAAAGFFLLRVEIMEFLLGWHGAAYADTRLAGNLMGLYAVSVVAISFKEIADRAFYSGKDSKTPAIFGVIIMVVNIAATLALLGRLGAYAMPVAYGIAAIIGGGGLVLRLHFKVRFINLRFVAEMAKTLVAVAVMFAAAYFARGWKFTDVQIVNLLLPALVGVAVYFVMARVLRISALGSLRGVRK